MGKEKEESVKLDAEGLAFVDAYGAEALFALTRWSPKLREILGHLSPIEFAFVLQYSLKLNEGSVEFVPSEEAVARLKEELRVVMKVAATLAENEVAAMRPHRENVLSRLLEHAKATGICDHCPKVGECSVGKCASSCNSSASKRGPSESCAVVVDLRDKGSESSDPSKLN